MTPQEIENKRQEEQVKRDKFKQKLKLARTVAGTAIVAGATQLKGLDRINQSINTKVADLQNRATDQLFELATSLGIEGLDTGNPTLPNLCPAKDILETAKKVRDNLVGDIEVVAKYVNIVDGSLTIVSTALNGATTSLDTINKLKTVQSVAAKLIFPVPGVIPALLSDLDDIRTLLTFKADGTPRLPELQRAVDLGTTYISKASQVLNTILTLTLFIDLLLQRCGEQIQEIPSDITKLTATIQNVGNTDTVYKGFIFEIVEKPFSPTLNQKIGQAKNKQGIVLLQTPPSFTQDPQVLIEELKFIIDRDNLKADTGPENNPVLPNTTTPKETPKTTTLPPSPPPPSVDTEPLGFAGKSVGEQAGIPRGLGNSEDIYEWSGNSWNFIGTRDI